MAKSSFGPSFATIAKVYAQTGVQRLGYADGKVNAFHVLTDNSGDCLSPVALSAAGKSTREITFKGGVVGVGNFDPRGTVDMSVRCRKCANCRRANSHHWAFRAVRELAEAQRTWFVTFTFSPEWHTRILASDRGEDRGYYREIQLFLKRLRKAGYKLRYLCARESHKSGFAHFHMLLHEHVTSKPLTNRLLSGNHKEGTASAFWHCGILHCRLVKTEGRLWDAAFYVCKYMGKEVQTRIPASQKYGGGRGGGFMPPPMPKKFH